jgi:secondary thiamine-phosphate synthase enzyme
MAIITEYISVSTRGHADIKDLSREAEEKLRDCGLNAGTVTFFVPGSTAGITTIEYEPGLLKDIPEMFDKIAPKGAHYHHDATWHDGNGNSHVRAALQGPSLVVPFRDEKMLLGTWQQIVLIDFDNRPRQRQVVMQIMGE